VDAVAAGQTRTERLVLREVTPAEAAQIVAGRCPQGQLWAVGYPLEGTLDAANMLLRMIEYGTARPGFGMYQLRDRDTGVVVGDAGFHAPPDVAGTVEIGYGLVPGRRGRGLATEAVRALVGWALEQPDVAEVRAHTHEGHAASQAVLTRAGFTPAGSDGGMRAYSLRR